MTGGGRTARKRFSASSRDFGTFRGLFGTIRDNSGKMSAAAQNNILRLRQSENDAPEPRSIVKSAARKPDGNPAAYPATSTPFNQSLMMRDEILDLYAFIFCQRGYRQQGLTFEQFLLVATAFKPSDLHASWKLPANY